MNKMTHRLIVIAIITFIALFEFWSFHTVYDMAYKSGYRDGVDKMVTTIDSAFNKQNKNISNGMEK
jgi:hypothetical protein